MNLKLSNMEQDYFILITTAEALQFEGRDGFYTNAYPKIEDDLQAYYYFVRKTWYDNINNIDFDKLVK